MAQAARLFAVLRSGTIHPRVRHYIGLPPEISEGGEEPTPLPIPDVLVIEESSPGSVFLYRETCADDFGADTWHQSVDDAKHQAGFEYGDAVGDWRTVPDDVSNARQFAIEVAKREGRH